MANSACSALAAHRSCRFASIVLASFVLLYGGDASAQDVLGTLTLGMFLNSSLDKVDQAITDARNAGNAVAIEAGRNAALAIQDAQNAYQDSLNKTSAQLNATIMVSVDQISTMTNDLSKKTAQSIQDAAMRSQQVVDSLPFAGKEPQVTSVSPDFVVPKDNVASNNLELNFNGNFPTSSENGYRPILKVNGKIFTGANTTQKLTFLIPQGAAFPVTAVDPGKLQFSTVSLIVPWEASRFFGLRHVRREDHFNVLIGSLPASPGKITVIHTTTTMIPSVKNFCSLSYHLASTRESGNKDKKNVLFTETPEPNWHVVRNTSIARINSAQGDYAGPSFVSDDADRVTYVATTIHHGLFGSSGSIDFVICFNEMQDQPHVNTETSDVPLKWGDSKSFAYAAGSWKVTFIDFTGNSNDFTGSDDHNKFITVQDKSNNLIIKADDPDSVKWP